MFLSTSGQKVYRNSSWIDTATRHTVVSYKLHSGVEKVVPGLTCDILQNSLPLPATNLVGLRMARSDRSRFQNLDFE